MYFVRVIYGLRNLLCLYHIFALKPVRRKRITCLSCETPKYFTHVSAMALTARCPLSKVPLRHFAAVLEERRL